MTNTDLHNTPSDDGIQPTNTGSKAVLVAEAVLLILGYALVMPVLLSSFDGAPNDAIRAWLNRSTANLWLLVAGTVAGLACWIGAAVVEKKHRRQGRMGGWKSLVRPVATTVTGLCGFCVCFSLPLLCITHL